MSRILTRKFKVAVKAATASVGDVASEAGYARITFDSYLNDRRKPTRAAALALASALERRSAVLAEHARRLREATDDQDASPD